MRRAVNVARFDGWTIGLFGALTLLFGLTTLSGVLLGGGMIAVAAFELRGANRLARLDAGQEALEHVPCSTESLFSGVETELAASIESRNQTVEHRIAPEAATLRKVGETAGVMLDAGGVFAVRA